MHEIPCPLEKASAVYGSQVALISGKKIITYEQYYDMAVSVSLGLTEQGVKPGSRVGIIANNCWEYIILLQALFRLGSVACLVSPRFPEKTILQILEKINCSTVVDPLDHLSPTASQHIQKIDLKDIFSCQTRTRKTHKGPDFQIALDADATIVLTSGTSGVPKAALHSFGNHYYNALGSNRNIVVKPHDRWLLSLPLYHVGGLGIVFRMLLGGGTVVIPESREGMDRTVAQYGITHVSLVSTQLYRWLKRGVSKKTADTLRAILVGGGPVPASLIKEAAGRGLPLYTTYGSTEMASQITTTGPEDPTESLFTSGKALEFRNLKIDANEIFVKGKTLFKGYVSEGKVTLPVDDEGWFRTSDMGALDGEGALAFLGRQDNMFISGGENITPEEIERQLCQIPPIAEAVVVPIEDIEFGFRPVAFVKTLESKTIDHEALAATLEQYLPRFKVPVAFYEWPNEEDTGRIKPDRSSLRKLAESRQRK
jgi:O-succinylbenzoic acid--CoA ligase